MRLGIAKLANLGADSTPQRRADLKSERRRVSSGKSPSNLLNRL